MSSEPPSLADQALANLIHQFARPLDCLRELVQNGIDAGSPRVEVAVAWDPPGPDDARGVLRILVDDWGEGMDEAIIDNQLTRLFASTKEDDLTKIGKFGIGFTSIFAIRPEAVLLRTGRHGEYWELLFHEDRSFDKIRIETPVDGTKITLFKRATPEEMVRFVEECQFVLTYWCEHSDTPVTFWDRTSPTPEDPPPTDDPFADFAQAPSTIGPVQVHRPLAIDDAPWTVRRAEGPIEVVVGYADTPRYGWYNGGLTLLHTTNTEALGTWKDRLAHLSFKVKYDRLEHTLTRDNVLQDEHWARAMAVVLRARAALQDELLSRIEADVAAGAVGRVRRGHDCLAVECGTPDGAALRASAGPRPLLRDVHGRPLSLNAVAQQERAVGTVLVATGRSPLHDALEAAGMVLVEDTPEARRLLAATEPWPRVHRARRRRRIEAADQVFVLPATVPAAALSGEERRLLGRTSALLRHAVGLRLTLPGGRVIQLTPGEESLVNRLSLRVGDFPASAEVLALDGPRDGRVFQRRDRPRIRMPAFLRWRTLLVNRNHALFRAYLLASDDDLELAALGLAQAILHLEGIEGEAAYGRMLDAISEPRP